MDDETKLPMTLTVSEANECIKAYFELNPAFADIYIKGEISNFTNHRTGHFYFTLKDEKSNLKAVMFRSSAQKMKFLPENGMKVIAHGRIDAFVRDGQYQLYADSMEPDGVGSLYIAFEQLKRKLGAEGLFNPERKRPLPKIPTRVGIITSPTGAAVRDIINISRRRFPLAKLLLYPSLVQGADAPQNLIEGLRFFASSGSADVIIIGRGGGSIEDLWAFNDEGVARAIAGCPIPVISAVGHETDFTIADFVADVRAPTPSAAAELALPDQNELARKLHNVTTHNSLVLSRILEIKRRELSALSQRRCLMNPEYLTDERKMTVMLLTDKLASAMERAGDTDRHRVANLASKLDALSPLAVLSRGYFAVYDKDGCVIKSVDETNIGDNVTLRASDGELTAVVTDKSVSAAEKTPEGELNYGG
ncbi:MAG: exodeoxyribonuclease VII large subunit [Clostridiales bacterium]|nr:exodeoxyribonuclease VII large subunit [Clostridiales bacterium]